jgi:hypothetical protein
MLGGGRPLTWQVLTRSSVSMNAVDWLLDSDPAIRRQALRDLTETPPEVVAAERARVASEGSGARLLALQWEDGHWAGGTPEFDSPEAAERWHRPSPASRGTLFLEWTSTTSSLALLRDFGRDPASAAARRAVGLVRERVRWEHDGKPFFAGDVESCINGRAVPLGACFGVPAGRPGRLHFDMDPGEGGPSRWNTLRAARVLVWYGRS